MSSADAFRSIRYVKYDGQTTIDLAGRSVTNWTNDFATEVRNAFVDSLGLSLTGQDVTIENVHSESLTAACRYLTIRSGSDVSFPSQPNVSAIWCYDSRINSSYPWSSPTTQFEAENCWIGIVFRYAQDNESQGPWLEFVGCTFQENVSISTKFLKMHRCNTHNNTIKIYPYKQDNVYKMYVDLQNNIFNNSSPIEFTKLKVRSGNSEYEDENVYDIIVNWTIVGNTFTGNDEGLRCRYYQYRLGQYYSRLFIAQSTGHTLTYSGNVGNCPDVDFRGVGVSDNQNYSVYELDQDHNIYRYLSSHKRCMPNLASNYSVWWNIGTVGGGETCIKWYNWVNSPYNSLTYDVFIQTAVCLFQLARTDTINDGDLF